MEEMLVIGPEKPTGKCHNFRGGLIETLRHSQDLDQRDVIGKNKISLTYVIFVKAGSCLEKGSENKKCLHFYKSFIVQ